jgi:hypothetical protein
MSTLGIERRRIGARESISLRGPLIVASVVVVFACFFAIGRATVGGSATSTESSSLPGASGSVAVPARLSTVPAIEFPQAPQRLVAAPTSSRPSATPAFSPAQPLAPAPSRAPRPSPQPAPSVLSAPQEAPVQQVHPAAPQPVQSTSGSSGSGAGASKPSAGGGGTFESSG